MAAQTISYDWGVTKEKVEELVRRIVATADPLQIIVFGSRARGDHREDSDVDVAVILDAENVQAQKRAAYMALEGLRMEADLVVASKAKYDQHRPWLNSVFNCIYREGVVVYDREHPQRARSNALYAGDRGRIDAAVSAS